MFIVPVTRQCAARASFNVDHSKTFPKTRKPRDFFKTMHELLLCLFSDSLQLKSSSIPHVIAKTVVHEFWLLLLSDNLHPKSSSILFIITETIMHKLWLFALRQSPPQTLEHPSYTRKSSDARIWLRSLSNNL